MRMPLGSIVGTCRITDCVRTDMIESPIRVTPYDISRQERAFGDYSPGRYAWALADAQSLDVPQPIRGRASSRSGPSALRRARAERGGARAGDRDGERDAKLNGGG